MSGLKKIVETILAACARTYLRRHPTPILGVAGSSGKTTAKEAIWAVLQNAPEWRQKRVIKSAGNLNTEIGLPLAILGFNKLPATAWAWPMIVGGAIVRACSMSRRADLFVLEYAGDRPRDTRALVRIARPTWAVVTTIGPSHLASYKTTAAVAEDAADLVRPLPPEGAAFLNQENVWTRDMGHATHARIVWFKGPIENVGVNAARAVARFFHVPVGKVRVTLKNFRSIAGRLIFERLPGPIYLLDDSYNANPESMQAAFNRALTLKRHFRAKRVVMVLGDMLDLGRAAPRYHHALGATVKQTADLFVGYGRLIGEAHPDELFTEQAALINYLLKSVRRGDMVVVKGSRGMRMEEIVAGLKSGLKKGA